MRYPNGLATVPWITSDFGWRLHPIFGDWRLHTGTDTIQHPGGLNYSPVTGVIIFASYNGGAGNHIKIREDVTGCVAELKHNAHLNWVFVGMRVNAGQGLAPTGTTGDSTGVHCHGEIRPDGVTPVDPIPYIAARLGGTAGDGGSTPFGDEFDMATLEDLKRTVSDVVTRDERPRLLECTTHKNCWVTIDWDLPSNDPAKIGYPKSKGQIESLAGYRDFLGDDYAQARKFPHHDIVVQIGLARGTDDLFTPSTHFKSA